MENKKHLLNKTSMKRKCLVLDCVGTVYRIAGDAKYGACEICDTVREIPSEFELSDAWAPEEADFIRRFLDVCMR